MLGTCAAASADKALGSGKGKDPWKHHTAPTVEAPRSSKPLFVGLLARPLFFDWVSVRQVDAGGVGCLHCMHRQARSGRDDAAVECELQHFPPLSGPHYRERTS